jgi:3-oxoacyl-[acyl-carrier protein] reductase
MVALMAPPTIEHRFDTAHGVWTADELAQQVGGYFADRDPDRVFAAGELKSLP